MLNLAARYKHSGALLFFDLDQFKYINDTSGHQAGDALLKMVARMLLSSIRNVDILGRLGGDEFAVILPQTTAEGAIEVAKNALVCLGQGKITVNGRTHKALASIGIALFPEHGNNVHDLLAAADLAMYQAKEAGRGGWHLFSNEEKTRERMHTLVYWKEKIEHALLHERFLFYFQPIMHIQDKTIDHYEVLLRMLDDDGAMLTPHLFIPAAEQTGLIHAIDHMVLRKSIAQSARNPASRTAHPILDKFVGSCVSRPRIATDPDRSVRSLWRRPVNFHVRNNRNGSARGSARGEGTHGNNQEARLQFYTG